MELIRRSRLATAFLFSVVALNLCPGRVHAQALDPEQGSFIVTPGVSVTDGPGAFSPAAPGRSPDGRGQGMVSVRNLSKQAIPSAEIERVYEAACATTRREFNGNENGRPSLTLVLGAKKDILEYPTHEIRLRRWDKYLFAQGVVILTFEDLLPREEKDKLAGRAVSRADATVDVGELKAVRAKE